MRRKSLTNSNKAENLGTRKRYRENRPNCELYAQILEILRTTPSYHGFFNGGFLPKFVPEGAEVHHIMMATPRWDVATNLLHLCVPVHQIVESRPKEGFVWCLYRKHRIEELDLPFMAEKMRHPLPSYLETFDTKGWHPTSVYWMQTLVKLYT